MALRSTAVCRRPVDLAWSDGETKVGRDCNDGSIEHTRRRFGSTDEACCGFRNGSNYTISRDACSEKPEVAVRLGDCVTETFHADGLAEAVAARLGKRNQSVPIGFVPGTTGSVPACTNETFVLRIADFLDFSEIDRDPYGPVALPGLAGKTSAAFAASFDPVIRPVTRLVLEDLLFGRPTDVLVHGDFQDLMGNDF